MCPQPLSRVRPDARVSFGREALQNRPELAALVSSVIGTWSYCEAEWCCILTNLLRADFSTVHEMYYVLRSADVRRQVLQAAAEDALNPDNLDIFNAVTRATSASRGKRNDFAHNIWGMSEEIPDGLLLASPKYVTYLNLHMTAQVSGQSKGQEKNWQNWVDEREKIFVYSKADLERELQAATDAHELISLLWLMLSKPRSDESERARNALLAAPRIQELLPNQSQ